MKPFIIECGIIHIRLQALVYILSLKWLPPVTWQGVVLMPLFRCRGPGVVVMPPFCYHAANKGRACQHSRCMTESHLLDVFAAFPHQTAARVPTPSCFASECWAQLTFLRRRGAHGLGAVTGWVSCNRHCRWTSWWCSRRRRHCWTLYEKCAL